MAVENPILNSPFQEPARHWQLSPEDGQPTGIVSDGRRPSTYIVPIAAPKRARKSRSQSELALEDIDEKEGVRVTPNDFINEVRGYVDRWRKLKPSQWGVSHETARLLMHWRGGDTTPRLFFCQIEAIETMIWLAEVAPKIGRRDFQQRLKQLNEEANAGLLRIAAKMATGSGKTTVMAMLIAWQTVNAVRGRRTFSDAFLVICPGITVKNRLNVLLPSDPKNYYETNNLVPSDMVEDIRKARIVVTNYHAFKHRTVLSLPKFSRSLLKGRGEEVQTDESDGQMLQRVCKEILARKNVIVLNDEAHHCYRHRANPEEVIDADEKDDAKKNEEAARLWITGIEALDKKVGVRTIYDVSATPFFLRGSGYPEGTLFPWVVSDFSLMDAIESGIVKIPRVPVSDNTVSEDVPVWRRLWKHLKEDKNNQLPIKGRVKQSKKEGGMDPSKLPPKLVSAIHALYDHYKKTYDKWWDAFSETDLATPPVFIVVCQNTSISKLVFDYISGYEREEKTPDGESRPVVINGALDLFCNYERVGQELKKLDRPNALLVDSTQLDSGEALTPEFKKIAGEEIEAFKTELIHREGQAAAEKITDEDLLREVMNTVGKPGRLGEKVRCVVSVSMLTEGWDANTVTHILGVRAFGTQLLCEQVVGRGLRRVSYDPNEEDKFEPEYADILGIPFSFMAEGGPSARFLPPKPVTKVHSIRPRIDAKPVLNIRFPRVQGYRVRLPSDKLVCTFSDDSKYQLDPSITPVRGKNEAIIGESVTLSIEDLRNEREKTVYFHVAGHALRTRFRDEDENLKPYLFPQLLKNTERWFRECLTTKDDTFMQMFLWRALADEAALRIYNACVPAAERGEEKLRPVLDPYNPANDCSHVDFITTKQRLWTTDAGKCAVNLVVGDSDWELAFCEKLEDMPEVFSYVKNQSLGFDVPYADAEGERHYRPDFIVRIDDGYGENDPLNLVVEIKGFRNRDAALKAETMNRLWIPAVNNHGGFGWWDFIELTDVYDQKQAIRDFLAARRKPEAAE